MAQQSNNTQNRINAARQAGLSDTEILQGMKESSRYKASFEKARAAGLSDYDIARDLGLKVQQPVKIEPEYEQPSFLADVGSGMDRVFSGIKQGALYAKDAVTGGDDYDKYTKAKAEERKYFEEVRQKSGKGMNVGGFIGETVATLPVATLAKGFQGAKVLSQAGAKVLGQNAVVGAGIGGTGFAENADERFKNVGVGAVGGAAGAAVGDKVGKAIGKTINYARTTKQQLTNQTQLLAGIDQKLDNLLSSQGIKLGDLSDEMLNGLRNNAIKALKAGKDLDKDTTARVALLNSLGIKGTRGQVTRDPKLWKQEAELAKIDGAGDGLRYKFVDDNAKLTDLLEDVSTKTGGNAPNPYTAMQGAMGTAQSKIASNKAYVDSIYAAARNADGNHVVLDGAGFANDAITALEKDYAMSSLPSGIHKLIKDISKNPQGFTLGKSEELIKILNREYKSSLQNGQPTSSTHAIGVVRDALNTRQEEAMRGIITQGGNDAAKLYQLGREAYKQNAQFIDSMPLLQDARKGIEPDKLFNKHILGGNVNEIEKTMKFLNDNNPQVANDIKQQVVEHIIGKAINNNGQPSPAAMSKVLNSLGDPKLSAIFSLSELKRLKDINRAMQYLIAQPPHSYVNNSNTASAAANFLLDVINKPFLRKLPILTSVKDLADSREASKALNPSLIGEKLPPTQGELNLYKRLVQAGLLSGASASTE